MTTVGSNGYTAPEVLKGEQCVYTCFHPTLHLVIGTNVSSHCLQSYGPPADVFSFAIVVSELITLRAPYSDLLEQDEHHGVSMTWEKIVAMTHKEGVHLRPTRKYD